VAVRFVHQRSRPDTIGIELVCNPTVPVERLQTRAEWARKQALNTARSRGWDGWLKIEVKEIRLTDRPKPAPLNE
jgi:hypothetical protein